MDQTFEDGSLASRDTGWALRPHLMVIIGCEQPLQPGARYDLSNADEVQIGRGEMRSLRRESQEDSKSSLTLVDRRVSSTHAALIRSPEGWTVEDRGSTNGTWVNGEKIIRAALKDGDVLELGQTFLRFRYALPTPAETPRFSEPPQTGTGPLDTLIPELVEEMARLTRVAHSAVSVLLLGETGTGKELVARAIHTISEREGDFVAVNCGALPSGLVESLLFGHVRGAFSGAVRDQVGYFRAAHRGTLFLDEIGDLPRASQAALLRALQEREATPVGSTQAFKLDFRVIAASHRPLDELTAKDEFRADLLARLAGSRHRLWPLRQRIEDLGMLVSTLLRRVAPDRAEKIRFSPSAVRCLLAHSWPLNIRELEQCLALAVTLTSDGVIQREHLPEVVARARLGVVPAPDPVTPGHPISYSRPPDDVLRAQLVAELTKCGGNISRVAAEMGKGRMQIHRWIKRFNLDLRSFRS